MSNRFVLIEDHPDFESDDETWWWWDTDRPGKPEDKHPYTAVQCYKPKNPNDFVRHENMALLFTDQAEYYAVCLNCETAYSHLQWSGSTRSLHWSERSNDYLNYHRTMKGWCEFCDPVFGNGGWSLY